MEHDILLWMSKFYYWFSIFIFYYSRVNYEYNNCALIYLLIGFLTNRFHMRQYLNSVDSEWSHIMLNTYLLITVQVYRLRVEKNCNFLLVDTILFVHVTICTSHLSLSIFPCYKIGHLKNSPSIRQPDQLPLIVSRFLCRIFSRRYKHFAT